MKNSLCHQEQMGCPSGPTPFSSNRDTVAPTETQADATPLLRVGGMRAALRVPFWNSRMWGDRGWAQGGALTLSRLSSNNGKILHLRPPGMSAPQISE